jgi:hypothetical protein
VRLNSNNSIDDSIKCRLILMDALSSVFHGSREFGSNPYWRVQQGSPSSPHAIPRDAGKYEVPIEATLLTAVFGEDFRPLLSL